MNLAEFKKATQKYRIMGWAKMETEVYLLTGLTDATISFAEALGTLEKAEDYDDKAGDIVFMLSDFCALKGVVIQELMPGDKHIALTANRDTRKLLIKTLGKLNKFLHEDMVGCVFNDGMLNEQLRIIIACLISACAANGEEPEKTLDRILTAEAKKLMQRYPHGCFTLSDHIKAGRRTAV